MSYPDNCIVQVGQNSLFTVGETNQCTNAYKRRTLKLPDLVQDTAKKIVPAEFTNAVVSAGTAGTGAVAGGTAATTAVISETTATLIGAGSMTAIAVGGGIAVSNDNDDGEPPISPE